MSSRPLPDILYEMPLGRPLRVDRTHRPPASKIPVPARKHAPLSGTASSQSDKTKATMLQRNVPQTELEKLESLRSKLEQSADEFIKARKELEEIFTAGGSSEQELFLTGSAAELKAELKRHRELTSRLESSSNEFSKDPQLHSQGTVKKGSSYEFLKSILG